ncbi:MAG: response regulator [Methanothrix sp.]|nr:MAG: response regulator [Methanothrix sp.]
MDEQKIPIAHLFVIEDDDEERVLLLSELKANGKGIDVRFFSDVYELIDLYKTHQQHSLPSLILLNAIMPKMDIGQAIDLIKGVQELRTVPLVVMIAAKSEKKFMRLKNLNVSGYVKKPIKLQILKRFLGIR